VIGLPNTNVYPHAKFRTISDRKSFIILFFLNKCIAISSSNSLENTEYFTTDNEPGGIENATHNTFATLTWIF
jgi:hypothetical protein